ncbi:MAG: Nif11-like leader peptide family natural product precursor [Actinomycetota bacterium]|nr:Nif11-like leader peptide family natural product precursor [Actinomycetota bacterium]
MNIEDYIKNLDPELQEKARACSSVEELLALAKEAKVPLPDEALAAIAGGDGVDSDGCGYKPKCPVCHSDDVAADKSDLVWLGIIHYSCRSCGHKWDEAID